MLRLLPSAYALLAAFASAAMLAAAHTFQRFGYEPCALCLRQREVYWVALPLALAGWAVLRRRPDQGAVVALLLGAVFLFGFAVAGYHAGVEWKWFPAPATCGGGSGPASAGDIAAMLGGAPVHYVLCDEAAWRMLGLSMAGWNALISLGLALLGVFAATEARGSTALRIAHV
ncbi:MAG: disulfide bond formation protein B [Proteobacteria bacterium]|nr:disulfide bond formation protein B [Pseudomonadota bacterium]